MNDKIFVDTNIWVYAHLETENDPKYFIANKLVEETIQSFTISTQVLHEYYSAMLKNKMADGWIQANLETMIEYCHVELISLSIIRLAYRIKIRYHFSYWDSLA